MSIFCLALRSVVPYRTPARTPPVPMLVFTECSTVYFRGFFNLKKGRRSCALNNILSVESLLFIDCIIWLLIHKG